MGEAILSNCEEARAMLNFALIPREQGFALALPQICVTLAVARAHAILATHLAARHSGDTCGSLFLRVHLGLRWR
jgi:hypothetical protein